jgi:hypothetical protein
MRVGTMLVAAVIGYFLITDMIHALTGPREVWVYPIWCDGKVIAGHTCDGTLGGYDEPSSFVAFPDRQEVVEFYPSTLPSLGRVTRLEGCVVFDWHTWTCTSGDPERTQAMNRGTFAKSFAAQEGSGLVFVSAWRYYWHMVTRK